MALSPQQNARNKLLARHASEIRHVQDQIAEVEAEKDYESCGKLDRHLSLLREVHRENIKQFDRGWGVEVVNE